MHSSTFFAVEKLKPIDPDITNTFAFIMGALFVVIIGMTIWHIAPMVYSHLRAKRTEKIKAANSIWFDAKESVLHRGRNQLSIERKSFEYFVCKAVLTAPHDYHNDQDIYDYFDHAKQKERAVYQAVLRLNKKSVAHLGLASDLFKRGKNSTSVNDIYRACIVNNS